MTPGDITIAVTVFDRRDYIEQAVASALAQTFPVRVMVVEDCGPDAELQARVIARFGSRIAYHRNARRRGLFDNWNGCLDLCMTPWLCLLHDDDFLAPDFVEAMVELAAKIPDKGLYYGRCNVVDAAGKVSWTTEALPGAVWQATDPVELALHDPVCFPGELFRADHAKALGGFRATSLFTGDWDMWAKLALHYGAAATNRVIGNVRLHDMEGRGTTRVAKSGKCVGLTLMQAKKNAAMLRRQRMEIRFDRSRVLKSAPLSTRLLLENARGFSPRMLSYNYGLLLRSTSPHVGHLLFQVLARLFGPGFLRAASNLYWLPQTIRSGGQPGRQRP
jgi:glycosyltransferase involved in cell wall biosynthesis